MSTKFRSVRSTSRLPLTQSWKMPLLAPESFSVTRASTQCHWPMAGASNRGVSPFRAPSHSKFSRSLYFVVMRLPEASVPETGSMYR